MSDWGRVSLINATDETYTVAELASVSVSPLMSRKQRTCHLW